MQRNLLFLLLVSSVLASSLAPATSHAAIVCQTKKGALAVRDRCKRGEVKLSAKSVSSAITVSQGAAGPQGIPGIQGPIGPQGIVGVTGPVGPAGIKGPKGKLNFSACRKVQDSTSNLLNPALSSLTVSVSCNPTTEFLFADQYRAPILFSSDAGTRVFLQSRTANDETINGDTRNFAVFVSFVRFSTVGQGIFSAEVEGLCCPRV